MNSEVLHRKGRVLYCSPGKGCRSQTNKHIKNFHTHTVLLKLNTHLRPFSSDLPNPNIKSNLLKITLIFTTLLAFLSTYFKLFQRPKNMS